MRRYDDLRESATAAVASFVEDVRTGTFPSSDETYHMTDQMEAFDLYAEPSRGRLSHPLGSVHRR